MRVTELDLSIPAYACLHREQIADVDQLVTHLAGDLLRDGFGAVELYEVVCKLSEHNIAFTASPRVHVARVPDERVRKMFRLRVVEGMTFNEVADAMGVSPERVRQVLFWYFGLKGKTPTVKARKWAATERRRADRQAPPATGREVA